MPVYDYECGSCQSRFERRQRFDDEPVAFCPECTGRARRVIHSVPVFFKGSGFYSTDHGKGLRDNAKPKEEASEVAPKSKSEDKPELKTEAKATEAKAGTTPGDTS